MSDYPNSGILNRNQFKRQDKHPDATGSARITCCKCGHENELEVAVWKREKGNRKFSLMRFEDKAKAEARKAQAKARKAGLPVEGEAAATQPAANNEQSTTGEQIAF